MKRLTLLLVPAILAAETFEIDSAHSAAQFTVKHMMVSNVRGSMGKVTGSINYDPKNLAASSVKATVDVLGINTNEPKRDEHLKSPDFFDASKYSTITFESTKWWQEGDKVKVAGNLTMHGVTKPVTLDVEVSPAIKDPRGGQRIGATATGKINRKDFGLTWSRLLETGGAVVGDDVSVTLDIEATSKS
jgi:polyisoprenoid-binding protein YceI